MEVQLEEVRTGYENTKKENIKLRDNLDTQDKLWKIWLSNFDENSSPNNIELKESSEESRQNIDEEVLVVEEEDDKNGDKEEDIDKVFENNFENLKETGFRKTTPVEQPVRVKKKTLSCEKCNFTTNSNTVLVEHIRKHTKDVTSSKSCNSEERNNKDLKEHIGTKHQQENNPPARRNENKNRVDYCHFWNNYGKCQFEFKNNRPCKFEHKNAPKCKFDGQCNRPRCMFQHSNQNVTFLANAQRYQRGGMKSQNYWNAPFPRQNAQGGIKIWENTRNF